MFLQLLRRRLQGEREGGFTLIELMVVVLIIAILIAIAIPTFLGGAEDALEKIGEAKPDCVMLDIAMAGMDGLELARRLREQFGDDIVLVAITGAPKDDPLVQATFVTVDHYFEKPVTLEQVQRLFPH